MPNSTTRHFDKFALSFDRIYCERRSRLMRWLDNRFRKDIFLRFQLTFAALEPLDGKTVLDIGCGSGIYLLESLNRGARYVTGIDPSKKMLESAANRLESADFPGKSGLIEGKFPGIGLAAHDHVIVMGVMDYIREPLLFLRALHPLVKLSAAVSFPSRHWYRTPVRKFRYLILGCPVFFYNESSIYRLSKTAGFSECRIKKIDGAGMDYHVALFP